MRALQGSYFHFANYCNDLVHNCKSQIDSSSIHLGLSESSMEHSSYLQEALNYIQSVQESLKSDLVDYPKKSHSEILHKLIKRTEIEVLNVFKRSDEAAGLKRIKQLFGDLENSLSELVRPRGSGSELSRLASLDGDKKLLGQRLRETADEQVVRVKAKYFKKLTESKKTNSRLQAENHSLRAQLHCRQPRDFVSYDELEKSQCMWQDAMEETEDRFNKLKAAFQELNKSCKEKDALLNAKAVEALKVKSEYEGEISRLRQKIGKLRLEFTVPDPSESPLVKKLQAEVETLKRAHKELPSIDGLLLSCIAKLDAQERAIQQAKHTQDFDTLTALFKNFREDIGALLKTANAKLSFTLADAESTNEFSREIAFIRLKNRVVELELELVKAQSSKQSYAMREDFGDLLRKLRDAEMTIKFLGEEVASVENDNRVLRNLVNEAKASCSTEKSSPIRHRTAANTLPNSRSSEDFDNLADSNELKLQEQSLLEELRRVPETEVLCRKVIELVMGYKFLNRLNHSDLKGVPAKIQAINQELHVEELARIQQTLARAETERSAAVGESQRLTAQLKQVSEEADLLRAAYSALETNCTKLTVHIEVGCQTLEPSFEPQSLDGSLTTRQALGSQSRVPQHSSIGRPSLTSQTETPSQTHSSDFKAKLAAKDATVQTLTRSNAELTTQLNKTTETLTKLEQEAVDARSRMFKLSKDLSDCNMERVRLEAQLADCRSLREELSTEVQKLTRESQVAKAKELENLRLKTESDLACRKLQAEVKQLRDRVKAEAELEKAKAGAEQAVVKYRAELEQANLKCKTEEAAKTAAILTKQTEIDALKEEQSHTERSLKQARAETEQLKQYHEDILNTIRSDLDKYDMKLADLKAESATLELELDEKTQEVAELQTKINEVESKAKVDNLNCLKAQERLIENEQQLDKANNDLKLLSIELKMKAVELAESNARNEGCLRDLNDARNELSLRELENENTDLALKELSGAYKSACELQNLQSAETKLTKARLKDAEDELRELRKQKANLEASFEQVGSTCKQYLDKVTQLKTKLRQVTQAKNDVSTSLDNQTVISESLRGQVDQLASAKKTSDDQLRTANHQLKEVSRKLKAMQAENGDLKATIQALQSRGSSPEIAGLVKKYDELIIKYTDLKRQSESRAGAVTRVEELEAELKKSHELMEFMHAERQIESFKNLNASSDVSSLTDIRIETSNYLPARLVRSVEFNGSSSAFPAEDGSLQMSLIAEEVDLQDTSMTLLQEEDA